MDELKKLLENAGVTETDAFGGKGSYWDQKKDKGEGYVMHNKPEDFYEDFTGEMREAWNTLGSLEIFSDDYAEIIERDESEREELKQALRAFAMLAKKLG